jgi:hypothetical protein
MLTQEYLKSILNYDQDIGIFTRKVKRNKKFKVGDVVGYIDNYGYVRIKIDKKNYSSHRLAWLYVYGEFPKKQLDHINGDKQDNRICNLREANQSQNNFNRKIQKNNTSGIKGVSWNKNAKKWEVSINVNGIKKHLGIFDSKEFAELVITEARNKYHKEFARNE